MVLRNSLPVDSAREYVDDYEITPEYYYERENGEIKVKERPWVVPDEKGVKSYSLLPQPVAVSLSRHVERWRRRRDAARRQSWIRARPRRPDAAGDRLQCDDQAQKGEIVEKWRKDGSRSIRPDDLVVAHIDDK